MILRSTATTIITRPKGLTRSSAALHFHRPQDFTCRLALPVRRTLH